MRSFDAVSNHMWSLYLTSKRNFEPLVPLTYFKGGNTTNGSEQIADEFRDLGQETFRISVGHHEC
jgi:hypothetical protein